MRSVMKLLALLAACFVAGGLRSETTMAVDIADTTTHGVVIEEVGVDSALAKAKLEPGDVLSAWRRLPAPPANPEAAQGELMSAFDWMWLRVVQAPRGTVELTGHRGAP